jgi:hypothetical protein
LQTRHRRICLPARPFPRLTEIGGEAFYNYDGCPVFLETAHYRNNDTLAVIMFSADGELYGEVTVNLNHPMQSKRMAFLDENNMSGVGKWIEKN